MRAPTKRNNMKVCLTVAMESLSRDNSILSRNFKPLYDNNNKRTKSYDRALRHVIQYTIARRLKMAYLGALPFYSPRKIQDGGRAQGDFTLGVHQMCHYSDTLKEGGSGEEIKRVIHGLSHMDFYGAFDAYRDVILKGLPCKRSQR
ncbi:MAG: hypothetical protein H6925_04890 [Holosporaceae bacterium]|nr:MAG: hypothetical protein H6925_04890 [Holosporaceae bacterium]